MYFLEYTPSSLTSDRQRVDLVYLYVLKVSSPLIHQATPPAVTVLENMVSVNVFLENADINKGIQIYFSKLISRVQELALFRGISLVHQEQQFVLDV